MFAVFCSLVRRGALNIWSLWYDVKPCFSWLETLCLIGNTIFQTLPCDRWLTLWLVSIILWLMTITLWLMTIALWSMTITLWSTITLWLMTITLSLMTITLWIIFNLWPFLCLFFTEHLLTMQKWLSARSMIVGLTSPGLGSAQKTKLPLGRNWMSSRAVRWLFTQRASTWPGQLYLFYMYTHNPWKLCNAELSPSILQRRNSRSFEVCNCQNHWACLPEIFHGG